MIKGAFRVFGKLFGFLSAGNLLSDILAATVVLLVLAGIYFKGYSDASISAAQKQTAGIEKNIKEYGQIKKGAMGMDESELDSYLSDWMRD